MLIWSHAGVLGIMLPDISDGEKNEEAQRAKSTSRTHYRGSQGQTTAHVRIDIGNGVVVTSSITNEAVDDLHLVEGDDVVAVIKASDVMVAK